MPTARKIEFDKTVPHQVKFNICGLAPNLNKEREWDTMGCGYLGWRAWLTMYSKSAG